MGVLDTYQNDKVCHVQVILLYMLYVCVFSIRGQITILCFTGHFISIETTQLCPTSVKAGTDYI